ncbi:hypothetical protein FJZ17_04575 [Candidatus Pacearchaeota archaeon]|nr:hypothetical protein [Candidatus Pacearchaeota archaeon]
MTYQSIFVCDPKKIKANNLPKSLVEIEFEEDNKLLDLWSYIQEKGKQLDWGSHVLILKKEEAIKTIKKYNPSSKSIPKIKELNLDPIGLVAEES